MPIAIFQSVGIWEVMLLLLVLLVVFGPKRLPEMGRSLGRGMREFKDSVAGDAEFDDEDVEDAELTDEVEVATAAATAEQAPTQPSTTQTEAPVAADPAPEATTEPITAPESEQTPAESEGDTERVSS